MDQPDDQLEIDDEMAHPLCGGHAFWLFREGERDYDDYRDLLPRRDAPVLISDSVLRYLTQPLGWIPTFNPRRNGKSKPQNGLNHYGPTIIASVGGESFHQICLGWAQIMAQGPEHLVLPTGGFRLLGNDITTLRESHVRTSRDKLVADLQQLAQFGEKTATGEYFILHLGI